MCRVTAGGVVWRIQALFTLNIESPIGVHGSNSHGQAESLSGFVMQQKWLKTDLVRKWKMLCTSDSVAWARYWRGSTCSWGLVSWFALLVLRLNQTMLCLWEMSPSSCAAPRDRWPCHKSTTMLTKHWQCFNQRCWPEISRMSRLWTWTAHFYLYTIRVWLPGL